jgi:hypothetical protein
MKGNLKNMLLQTNLHVDPYAMPDASANAAAAGLGAGMTLFYLALLVLSLVSMAKVFMKAGRQWWEGIIPIYNIYVLSLIVGRPVWWLLLFFIPFANIIIAIILMNDLSKAFGKGVGFTVGLILLGPIFMAILAFGSAQYQGVSAATASNGMGVPASTPIPSDPMNQPQM